MRKSIVMLIATAPIILPAVIYAGPSSNMTTKQQFSDSMVTTKVKAKLATDKAVRPLTISVFTYNGIVTLKGVVDSDIQYERAIELAQSTSGVKEVESDGLHVKDSKAPLKDIAITAKINGKVLKQKIFTDKQLQYSPISVETKNGIVYVKGKVKSEQVKENILSIVKSTKGAKGVMDLLKVAD